MRQQKVLMFKGLGMFSRLELHNEKLKQKAGKPPKI